MEPKGFMGYPKRGSACELNSYGHEQYPSYNMDQNNSIHGVHKYLPYGITFLLGLNF